MITTLIMVDKYSFCFSILSIAEFAVLYEPMLCRSS